MTDTHQIGEIECASTVVLRAVAARSGTPILDLEPLYGSIDPETLDSLIKNGSNTCISFDYQDFSVTVDSERVCIE